MSVVALLPSWQLALESDNKFPKTIKSYTAGVRSLSAFLRAQGMPDDIEDAAPEHIRAFLVAARERTSPAFAQQLRLARSTSWDQPADPAATASSCSSALVRPTTGWTSGLPDSAHRSCRPQPAWSLQTRPACRR
jgi:hypothetical protein